MFTIQYTDKALKSLKKIPKNWQKRIDKAIEGLISDPYQGKKLQGELKGLFSLRIWPYRVIYTVQKRIVTVVILDIGHRQNVYK